MPLKSVTTMLAFALSCSHGPGLCPRYDSKTPFGFGKDWITKSDVIAAGTIVRAKSTEQHSWGTPARTLSLYKVEFKTEYVLKGRLGDRDHFFVYLDESTLPKSLRPSFDLSLGRRSIFFLREENGVLRTIDDVFDYRIGLSGSKVGEVRIPANEYGTDHYVGALSVEDSRAAFGVAQLLLAPPSTTNVLKFGGGSQD